MNDKLLILGSVILLIGIFGYTYSDMRLNEYDTLASEFERAFDEDAQQDYRNWTMIKSVSAAAVPAGLILVIAGFVRLRSEENS